MRRFLSMLFFLGLSTSTAAMASVSLPFSTSFDSSGCAEGLNLYNGASSCSGLSNGGNKATKVCTYDSVLHTSANNPLGSGRGVSHCVDAGKNYQGGTFSVSFPKQTDLWVRAYIRFPSGFTWSNLQEYKLFWISDGNNYVGSQGSERIFSLYAGNTMRFWNQYNTDGNEVVVGTTGHGWNILGDGNWHYIEAHVKYNSGSNGHEDGWLDGVQVINKDLNMTNSSGGWASVEFMTNADSPAGSYEVQMDDVAISNTGYIGPLSGTGGSSDTTAPTITSFTIPPTATSLTVPITTFTASDNSGLASSPFCVTTTNSNAGCSWTSSAPTTVTFSSSGTKTAYAWVKDAAGNIGSSAASVTITAPVNGACGSANGQPFSSLTAGSSNLCSSGTVASFAGAGPWTWGCNGSNGGTSTSVTACSASYIATSSANLLFSEDFENTSFSSRGWYDGGTTGITTSESQSGTHAAQFSFTSGATSPSSPYAGAMRKLFTPTESLYVSFYIKFATGWQGSQQAFHPHMFFVLSDLDGDYQGMANAYLDTYIEFLSDIGSPYTIRPQLALQDAMRVNYSLGTPPNNLSSSTENRSVGYCNSPLSSGATGDCYTLGSNYWWSASTWRNATTTSIPTNAWHKVDVFFKMNSISGGVGKRDGIMQEWIDGVQVINQSDVLYRTNQDATKKFKQFVIAPYIQSPGSPVAQTFYLDNLNLWDGIPASSTMQPVTGVKVISITNP